ncbi:uncharacterized protein SCHCODRAFT_02496198 [Schizophyllum commune H4-8]|uniref:uncharacterized protein n=1 Tax=Schizophyllum commune (strain H4-8 / FGSC 9210) TaxID=578458 RepID=UPI0021604DD0|nr:uncharacterized protein SCHCODRAFT_02496198 [Schizophyllum commune H4-8]KAI5894745.1 hypothetical protein SCHCODRAFT_02496198 [Schizophyllum commune H4-8]
MMRLHGRVIAGALYSMSVTILLGTTAYLYVSLCRYKHVRLRVPPPNKGIIPVPYECANSEGDLEVCTKDKCAGAWKPPRAHHCSMCGVCRLDFDHHCPWLGNCVTKHLMKQFLLFITLTPVAVGVAVAPILGVMLRHATTAIAVSRQDAWARSVWWDWWGSWIFLGGPVGRYVVGGILGVRAQRRQNIAWTIACHPGCLVEQPHLRLMVTAGFGVLFALFAWGLSIMVIRNILRGRSMLEMLRTKSVRYICIPAPRGELQPGVYAIDRADSNRLYDLGARRNWMNMISRNFSTRNSAQFLWPEISPDILAKLQKRAD